MPLIFHIGGIIETLDSIREISVSVVAQKLASAIIRRSNNQGINNYVFVYILMNNVADGI